MKIYLVVFIAIVMGLIPLLCKASIEHDYTISQKWWATSSYTNLADEMTWEDRSLTRWRIMDYSYGPASVPEVTFNNYSIEKS